MLLHESKVMLHRREVSLLAGEVEQARERVLVGIEAEAVCKCERRDRHTHTPCHALTSDDTQNAQTHTRVHIMTVSKSDAHPLICVSSDSASSPAPACLMSMLYVAVSAFHRPARISDRYLRAKMSYDTTHTHDIRHTTRQDTHDTRHTTHTTHT